MATIHKISTTVGSDKEFVVPQGRVWRLDTAHIIFTTSATVGNRELTCHIHDADGNTIADYHANVTQAASTTRHYSFQHNVPRETAFAGTLQLMISIPDSLQLLPGYTLHFYDINAVDAGGDTMSILVQVTQNSLGAE